MEQGWLEIGACALLRLARCRGHSIFHFPNRHAENRPLSGFGQAHQKSNGWRSCAEPKVTQGAQRGRYPAHKADKSLTLAFANACLMLWQLWALTNLAKGFPAPLQIRLPNAPL